MLVVGGPLAGDRSRSGALIIRISTLIKETPERSLAPSAMGAYSEKKAMYEEAGTHHTPYLAES